MQLVELQNLIFELIRLGLDSDTISQLIKYEISVLYTKNSQQTNCSPLIQKNTLNSQLLDHYD